MCRMLSSSSMVLCVGLCVLVVCFMGCPKPAQEGPQAAFSHTPGSGYDPLTVDFTDQSVAGSSAITAWSWSFGDGGSSTEQAPRHIYTVPGVYSVALTVTSGDGTDTETVSDWMRPKVWLISWKPAPLPPASTPPNRKTFQAWTSPGQA